MKNTVLIRFVLALTIMLGMAAPVLADAAIKVFNVGQDFYPILNADTLANGGFSVYGSSPYHGTGSLPSPQAQRICYDVDPTAYPTAWSSGAYKSPGDNSVVKWDGTVWKRYGAKHNNNHISGGSLECSTMATADTALSASQTTIQAGASTTLTWASQYGKLRQATCTGTNFTTDTTVPGHFETVLATSCGGGGGGLVPLIRPNAASVPASTQTAGCTPYLGQVWVPTYTGAAPFGGSKDVAPTQTTTYTYTCTNANGSSSQSVTVYVGGNQCTDGVDNDHDGLVDAQDPGCAFTPPGSPGGSPGGTPTENGDMPDLIASAVSPTSLTSGHPVTLTSTITNNGGTGTQHGFTNLFQIDSDADHSSVTASLTDSTASLDSLASEPSHVSYTFPNNGTWYVRACADNDAAWKGTVDESNEDNNCSAGGWTQVTVGDQGTSLSADPQRVVYDNGSTLTWACGKANSASIDNGVGTVSPADRGTVDVAHILQTTTYTLTCVGAQIKQAYTTVEVLPPTLTIKVTPAFVRPDGSTTVSWDASAGAKGCTVSGWGLETVHTTHDSAVVTNIQNSQTYTLTCNGAGSQSATVNLLPNYREK